MIKKKNNGKQLFDESPYLQVDDDTSSYNSKHLDFW
jgi:hypothetical protein